MRCLLPRLTRDVMCPWGTSSGSSSLKKGNHIKSLEHIICSSDVNLRNRIPGTHIFASTYPTILPFSSSAMYESWNQKQQTMCVKYTTLNTVKWMGRRCGFSRNSRNGKDHSDWPEARTVRDRNSISSGNFLEDRAGYSAACSWGPPAAEKERNSVRQMNDTMLMS